ncbi:MAG: ABC transporter permease [Desulfurococcales archaeon]|nr:ABC transporter permease [Desulfurococcales archaeon]MCE4622321.1 ABC transporter permease [Desulfurococcales archaeon]MCE4629533.1 ABC transporter permease [Desulfurococcales archaeon]
MFDNFKSNMRIVLRTWSGKIGIALLLIQVILALYAVAAYYPDGMKLYEQGKQSYYPFRYPSTVPPCWVVSDKFPTETLTLESLKENYQVMDTIPEDLKIVAPDVYDLLNTQFTPILQMGMYKIAYVSYDGTINLTSQALPSDVRLLLTLRVPSDLQANGTVIVSSGWMYIERPDGLIAKIFYAGQLYSQGQQNITNIIPIYGSVTKQVVDGNVTYQALPETLYNYKNSRWISTTMDDTLKTLYSDLGIPIRNETRFDPRVIFATSENGTLVGLPGTYKVHLAMYAIVLSNFADKLQDNIGIEHYELKLMGNCYGFFGTDVYSRPIGLGLLLGLPYAFLLGFTVTFISTFIGAIYGTLAGYWKDIKGEILMRIADVMLSLPFLPILIAISYAFGTITLKSLAIIMIALSWAGPVIVVRSMALQISEQLYIEAAKAVGVPTRKIVFKHIFPQIYPYTMAIAVLAIPGIIVAEASLALLGFGDPAAPTWGKMLQLAYNVKAVTTGWWWMYIFPGLALVIFSATFLLIGRAIEPIVAPKLQR